MLILPAIDIRNGACVRLRQGRYDEETVYDRDPASVAATFAAAGFSHLHVVDLDGARAGSIGNLDVLRDILAVPGVQVEVGGGIRDRATVDRLLSMGVGRVMLGSMAVREPAMVRTWLRDVGGTRIALAVDMQEGRLAAQGWTQGSEGTPVDFIQSFLDDGAITFHCTDISRDGMMRGPNLEWYHTLRLEFAGADLIASGGVTTVDDLTAIRIAGMNGAVIGRALYEGSISLTALKAWGETTR